MSRSLLASLVAAALVAASVFLLMGSQALRKPPRSAYSNYPPKGCQRTRRKRKSFFRFGLPIFCPDGTTPAHIPATMAHQDWEAGCPGCQNGSSLALLSVWT